MPPHKYSFHIAILSTNRQVNSEAANVFYRQNSFVSVSCGHPRFGREMANSVILATGHHASNFKHVSMAVHVGPHGHKDEVLQLPCEKVIIAGEDVASFGNMLPTIYFECVSPRSREDRTSPNVFVQINAEGILDVENEHTSPQNDCPSVIRLLEPFCHLHGLRISVGGVVTPSYKERIEQCAARTPPTFAELISMVCKYKDEGDEAKEVNNFVTAAQRYESALEMLDEGHIRLIVHPETIKLPAPLRREDRAKIISLQLHLRSLLASTYLALGEHSKAYRCAQDLGLTNSYYFRYHDYSEARQLCEVCAHIMLCKALAGKELGQPVQALMDLDLGLRFAGYNDNYKLRKERKLMCVLVLKKLDSDLGIKWTSALATKSTKHKQRQTSKATEKLAQWRDLENLIKGRYVA